MAAPYIHKGLQVGIEAGVTVMAEAMPYCMMQGYEKHIVERIIPHTEIKLGNQFEKNHTFIRKTKGKIKFPQCKQCKYNKLCEGPWKEYPEKFGNEEFIPVKDYYKNGLPKTGKK
jgi:radical SAM protein with 4Fe4S-binding SPASM domain